MNKFELLKAAIKGSPVERIPYAFWTHFPGIDLDAEKLAENTYSFFRKYNVDFIKVMSNGMYAIEDYGCDIDYSDVSSGGVAKLIETPVKNYTDWGKIKHLDINEGSLGREIRSLSLLKKQIGEEAPICFTVFSPLTIANKLANGQIVEYIRSEKNELLHQALFNIANTVAELSSKAVEAGASGVFFATQLGNYDIMTESEYREYGVTYDRMAIKSVQDEWFNILHIHGNSNIMFNVFKDYPLNILNWHVWETEPEINEAREITDKCIMGGINRFSITKNDQNALRDQIRTSIQQSGGKKHILTPGCVIRYPLRQEALFYIAEVKNTIEKEFLS